MKKFLWIAAALALALPVACNKDEKDKENEEPVKPKDEITLISDALVNVEAESSIVPIQFTTNAAWTATADQDFVVLNTKAGEAGENLEIKATIQSLPEDVLGRSAVVTINAGNVSATVTINQGIIFLVSPASFEAEVAGGEFNFTVTANVEYSVKTYDSFDWAPATFDQATGKGSFKVAANGGYSAREAYIKFTIPAIQDPVLDEETGEPTGETTDHVERLYVYQKGNAQVVWTKSLPSDFDVVNTDDPIHDATVSVANFGGKILVSDATKLYEVDPATGAMTAFDVPEGLPVQSICNDDAGNLLLADLMLYNGVGKVWVVKADDAAMASPKLLIPFVNDAWSGSRGADKVAARGDVFSGNGVVTMIYGGVASYGGLTYGLVWEITGGEAAVYDYNEWNKSTNLALGWFSVPALADDIWLSNRAAFAPAGDKVSDGFFYSGYDGLYNLYYSNGTEWTAVAEGVGDWAYAMNSFATINWDGKKILAGVKMAYFPEWGMPGQLQIYDVTDPTAPVLLAASDYTNDAESYVTGAQESSTTSVALSVEGTDLSATVIDSDWGLIFKMKFPKL